MSAIPKSGLPGHRQLHERTVAALERCQELRGVDFKESCPWEDVKWHVIQSVLGMGNLRDGGIVVIGVAQRGDQWELAGVEGTHLGTYDVDVLTDQVNKYVSPPVTLDVVLVDYGGKQFLAIHAHEFDDTPLVCRKNGPDGVKAAQSLKEGAVFVRPPGVARTTRVVNAEQMHDLLQLAAEKRARRLLEGAHRIGMVPRESSRELFGVELQELLEASTNLEVDVLAGPHWRVVIRPETFDAEHIPTLADCWRTVEQATVRLRGWPFPALSTREGERAQGNNWVASWAAAWDHREYWRLYQSGQFVHLDAARETVDKRARGMFQEAAESHRRDVDWSQVPGFITYPNLLYRITEFFEFAARVCQRGVYTGRVLVGIGLHGVKGYALTMPTGRNWPHYCVAGAEAIERRWTFDSAELVAASADRSLAAARWLLERFGWAAPPEVLESDQMAFLERRL